MYFKQVNQMSCQLQEMLMLMSSTIFIHDSSILILLNEYALITQEDKIFSEQLVALVQKRSQKGGCFFLVT